MRLNRILTWWLVLRTTSIPVKWPTMLKEWYSRELVESAGRRFSSGMNRAGNTIKSVSPRAKRNGFPSELSSQ